MKNNGWKSYICLEIVEKMNRFALLNFTIFLGQCPQTPILGRGYGAPPQTPSLGTPALCACVPLHRSSMCVVDILRYFRPCDLCVEWAVKLRSHSLIATVYGEKT